MEKHGAAGRLGPKDLSVPSDIETPSVAVAAVELFEGGAVRFETDDTGAVAAELDLAIR